MGECVSVLVKFTELPKCPQQLELSGCGKLTQIDDDLSRMMLGESEITNDL
jgi:hypothetical protein